MAQKMEYLINTDPDWLDLNVIHAFLLEPTGWAQGIPREVAARSNANSLARPDSQSLRRWILVTADAHELYGEFGLTARADPERVMVRRDPDVYKREA